MMEIIIVAPLPVNNKQCNKACFKNYRFFTITANRHFALSAIMNGKVSHTSVMPMGTTEH